MVLCLHVPSYGTVFKGISYLSVLDCNINLDENIAWMSIIKSACIRVERCACSCVAYALLM